MIKIAIFAEGQTELFFIRNLLFKVIDNSKLKLDCFKLRGGRMMPVSFPFSSPTPHVDFLIINVGNDEKVLSAIKEREEKLFSVGYQRIIGLRDMYSKVYDSRSHGVINDKVTKDVIESAQEIIDDMSNPDSIRLYFAIMEMEAWFLSMYNLFSKINGTLSINYIENKLKINLKTIDPQKEFYKPSNMIFKILRLIGRKYDKSEDDSEMICSKMAITDFDNAIEKGRCSTFKDFYGEIKGINAN